MPCRPGEWASCHFGIVMKRSGWQQTMHAPFYGNESMRCLRSTTPSQQETKMAACLARTGLHDMHICHPLRVSNCCLPSLLVFCFLESPDVAVAVGTFVSRFSMLLSFCFLLISITCLQLVWHINKKNSTSVASVRRMFQD